MHIKLKHIIVCSVFFLFSCKSDKNTAIAYNPILKSQKIFKTAALTDSDLKNWAHKDIIDDTIPGISLEKAYNTVLKGKKGNDVIVAVIDTKLNIYHEDLKDQIWVNPNEIPGNGIDDDKNGYIDDVNGWNFLGNVKGEDIKYQPSEDVRIERKYAPLFKGKKETEIAPKDAQLFKFYNEAKAANKQKLAETDEHIINYTGFKENIEKARIALKDFFPDGEYTLERLKEIDTVNNGLSLHYRFLNNFFLYMKTDEALLETIEGFKLTKKITDIAYNERQITGDNDTDVTDAFYGNNIIDGDVPFKHSILVSGVLASTRSNGIGIKGISDNIKIMPVVMVASGEEHDKDIALAIRYAVDNGAKIINMSWSKPKSLNKEWVIDAMKYAAKNDVLLVTSAGNSNVDIDIKTPYPKDVIDTTEFVNNLISVGASAYDMDKGLKASFSNYGKETVDIFAPGSEIYTTTGENEYDYNSGTSLATPIVCGVAALILSHYPDLSVVQVKDILLKSGISYDMAIDIKNRRDKTSKLIPFNELSKSGKIVNAYNALIMADKKVKSKR